ncbi:MAG: hypothetical protein KA152_07975 [Verrucomicrobiales bacterium]|nr:hypothetical protein [Verrucomicrobiales bacterium]
MEKRSQIAARLRLLMLIAAAMLPTLGVILLIYAACCRGSAAEFLARGEIHDATVSSITSRKQRHGGWEVTVGFWDRSGGVPPPGKLITAVVSDLLPLSGVDKKPGSDLRIRWIRDSNPPRVAPEASLHDTTRPWEQGFTTGGLLLATGTVVALLAKKQRRTLTNPKG